MGWSIKSLEILRISAEAGIFKKKTFAMKVFHVFIMGKYIPDMEHLQTAP